MDEQTLANWRKIKETMEASGNTGNQYYKRAVAILSGKPDPMSIFNPPLGSPRQGSSDTP